MVEIFSSIHSFEGVVKKHCHLARLIIFCQISFAWGQSRSVWSVLSIAALQTPQDWSETIQHLYRFSLVRIASWLACQRKALALWCTLIVQIVFQRLSSASIVSLLCILIADPMERLPEEVPFQYMVLLLLGFVDTWNSSAICPIIVDYLQRFLKREISQYFVDECFLSHPCIPLEFNGVTISNSPFCSTQEYWFSFHHAFPWVGHASVWFEL